MSEPKTTKPPAKSKAQAAKPATAKPAAAKTAPKAKAAAPKAPAPAPAPAKAAPKPKTASKPAAVTPKAAPKPAPKAKAKAAAKPVPKPTPRPMPAAPVATTRGPVPKAAPETPAAPEPVVAAHPPVKTEPAPAPAAKKPNLGLRAVVDYAGPVAFLVAFLITRNILQATWALVAVSALALAFGFAVERRVAPMPLLTGGAALVFGVLTLFFHNPVILKMKPTFINLALGSGLLIGARMGKNPLKLLMGEALHLSEAGWKRLTLRYGVFFLCVAVLNEIVWRTQSDAVWVWFKMPGLPVLALLFSVTQVPGMLKDAKAAEIALKAAETQD